MLRSVLHQPMSFFDTNPTGRILNRFSRDMDAIDSYLADLMRIYCTNVSINDNEAYLDTTSYRH